MVSSVNTCEKSLPQDILRQLQEEELDILRVVDELCERLDLTYWLDSGTALGAVRHGGFIPWDDDIDIGMLRCDYERFLQEAPMNLPRGYSLHTYDNTPGFAGFFAKVYRDGTKFYTKETIEADCNQAVFIDIFPYDVLPKDEGLARSIVKKAYFWQCVSYLYHSCSINIPFEGWKKSCAQIGCRLLHHVLHLVASPQSIKRHYMTYVEAIARDKQELSSRIATLPYGRNYGPFELSWMIPTRRALFENTQLALPCNTEAYLEAAYGATWCELPPEADRKTHAPLLLELSNGTQFG